MDILKKLNDNYSTYSIKIAINHNHQLCVSLVVKSPSNKNMMNILLIIPISLIHSVNLWSKAKDFNQWLHNCVINNHILPKSVDFSCQRMMYNFDLYDMRLPKYIIKKLPYYEEPYKKESMVLDLQYLVKEDHLEHMILPERHREIAMSLYQKVKARNANIKLCDQIRKNMGQSWLATKLWYMLDNLFNLTYTRGVLEKEIDDLRDESSKLYVQAVNRYYESRRLCY